MTIREYHYRYSRYGLPPEVLYAGEFLEARGYEFLKDFGWQNAVQKAADILVREMDEGGLWFLTIWID